MDRVRTSMTVRRVPLRSMEAAESRVGGTISERLALVTTLSLAAWANTGRPVPVYDRAHMPFRRTTLRAAHDRD